METVVISEAYAGNILKCLEGVARSRQGVELELPSGARLVVFPKDDFETLRAAFQDPVFFESLEKAVHDVKEGRVKPFDERLFDDDL